MKKDCSKTDLVVKKKVSKYKLFILDYVLLLLK